MYIYTLIGRRGLYDGGVTRISILPATGTIMASTLLDSVIFKTYK